MTVGGDKDVEKAQQVAEEQRARLTRTVEKLILASIGAVALAQETLEDLLDRMVARGEQVQDAARKQVDELRETRQRLLGSAKQKVSTELDAADFPAKTDLVSLQNQVDVLSAKVDELSVAKRTASDTGTGLILPEGSAAAHNDTPVSGT